MGLLHEIGRLKHQRIEVAPLDPKTAMLRTWQSQRLTRTYADLLALPRYRPACLFFLEEIYAARDFSQRDRDMEQMYEVTKRFIPDAMLRPLALTVELYELTEALDRRLSEVLTNRLGVTDALTAALYAEAYRLCDNYDDRVRQIELISEIGRRLDGIVRSPLTGALLNLAKGPARSAGWEELVNFLVHGYKAFKHMNGAKYFLGAVRRREMRILDAIYASDPDPFGFDGAEDHENEAEAS
jgi:hypothetical protein